MRILKLFSILTLIVILVILWQLFVPRSYDVKPFKERQGSEYWDLATGSKIGYYKIESNSRSVKNPIIYLHGGPGGKITDQIVESLRPFSLLGHDLYLYDQVGSGHSERLKDITEYSVDRHRRDLEEIVSKIESEKVILLGHSWGAVLAINYLQSHSARIEKLILSGPGPILPISSSAVDEAPPRHLSLIEPEFTNKQGNRKANNWRSRLMTRWAYIRNSKLASDHEADDFFTYLNHELSKSNDCVLNENRVVESGGGYYSHIMTLNSIRKVKNRKSELKEMEIPILILRGQCDNQKWGYTKEYLDLFRNSELEVIEGAGHNILNSKKEKYYELIYNFLMKNGIKTKRISDEN